MRNIKISHKYTLGFALGLFTFLTEIILLRQMSVFFGSGIKATGLIIFLFILGIGIGDLLAIKNFKKGHLIIAACSISLIIIAILPQIIYQISSHKTFVTILFSLLVTLPGIISGYFYATIIRDINRDSIVTFILFNTIGSLLGCLLSFMLFKITGAKEILAISAFSLIPFLIKQKKVLIICILINTLLLVYIFFMPQKVDPAVYYQILKESKEITFPTNAFYAKINQDDIIFSKPSQFGEVVVDNNYNLYVHNEGLCTKNSIEERDLSKYLDQLTKNPSKVLVIGLGCGITLDEHSKLNTNPEADISVVEINPVVVEAQEKFFDPIKDSRVNLVVEDGFSYLTNSTDIFDMIIVDVSNPISLESSTIYTKEFVELVYNHLTDNGIVGWWNFRTNNDIYDHITYSTLRESFPYIIFKKMDYSILYFASKKPIFLHLTKEEAEILNRYTSSPLESNSIYKPLFK